MQKMSNKSIPNGTTGPKNYTISSPIPIPNNIPEKSGNRQPNKFSRYLSSLLRHRAVEQKYQIDPRGFVSLGEIIKRCNNITLDEIYNIVETDGKKRFEIEKRNDGIYIRAVQGHSIPGIDADLVLINDPSEIPIVVHGTNPNAYASIKTTGLNCMERIHIHFAHGTVHDQSVISGMRKTAKVMIFIDVSKAMNDGIRFYKSSNGVILSEGINGIIDPKYFLKVDIIN